MTFNRWHLIAVLIGILGGAGAVTFGPLSQRHADQVLRQRADSLQAEVTAFNKQHDFLVAHVDTVRSIKVVTLAHHADTIIQEIHSVSHDTVVLHLVDSAAVVFHQAIDTLKQQVVFWRGEFQSDSTLLVKSQKQLHDALSARDPLLSFGFGPVGAVVYDPIGHRTVGGVGVGVMLKLRLPHFL